MEIAFASCAIIFAPLFNKLFPEIPKDSKAHGSIIMNISANMLGLDNAATPLGLKAMGELQKHNKDKTKASNAQILFLVLNTSGLTLIPTSIIALRATAMAENNMMCSLEEYVGVGKMCASLE